MCERVNGCVNVCDHDEDDEDDDDDDDNASLFSYLINDSTGGNR